MPDITVDSLGTLAPTVTHRDVQLCRVGVWGASTGTTPVTLADLQSMLRASTDPQIDTAALFIGHIDQRTRHLADGEPALGWVKPTRVTDGVLYGDLEDVPAKFAAVMTKAYRRRSIEVKFNRDPKAQYQAVLTGLALLGVHPPAVKGLADVISRYSAASVPFEHVPTDSFVVEDVEDALLAAAAGPPSKGDLTDANLDQLVKDNPADKAMIDKVRKLPPPMRRAALAHMRGAKTAMSASDTPGGVAVSAAAGAGAACVGGATPQPGGQAVPSPADKLRTMFGLADGYDVGALQAKLTAALADGEPASPALDGEDLAIVPVTDPATAAGVAGVGAGTPRRQFTEEELEAAKAQLDARSAAAVPGGPGGKDLSVGELQVAGGTAQTQGPTAGSTDLPDASALSAGGVVTLSAGQYEALRTGATRGLEAGAELDRQRRDAIVVAALSAGRLTPDEASKTWRPALDRDESGTTALLSSLAEGRVPTTAIGHSADVVDATAAAASDAAFTAWETALFGGDIFTPAPTA